MIPYSFKLSSSGKPWALDVLSERFGKGLRLNRNIVSRRTTIRPEAVGPSDGIKGDFLRFTFMPCADPGDIFVDYKYLKQLALILADNGLNPTEFFIFFHLILQHNTDYPY
ncbi:MAG: hypothetical protein OEY01_00620 [Desulfobulbaceae bacterium]|nr:hypothetical protein [Desulfobulbaceae bacterium]HIJ77795.1 hypothetical protein [Deltaproteobacteria bacterium]